MEVSQSVSQSVSHSEAMALATSLRATCFHAFADSSSHTLSAPTRSYSMRDTLRLMSMNWFLEIWLASYGSRSASRTSFCRLSFADSDMLARVGDDSSERGRPGELESGGVVCVTHCSVRICLEPRRRWRGRTSGSDAGSLTKSGAGG